VFKEKRKILVSILDASTYARTCLVKRLKEVNVLANYRLVFARETTLTDI
jgi:hypothetical protein